MKDFSKSNLLPGLRAASAVLAAVAVVGFGRAPQTPSAPPLASPSLEPALRRVSQVGADGWRIEVDGVPIDAPGRMPSAPQPVHDLRLDRLALFADSIGRYSTEEAVDWRLVAAVIAEESSFDPDALSPAGAFGLMQVKEVAARDVGVYPYDDPDSNIRAGIRYLAQMREEFPAPNRPDRLALMLAAYNMGPGHLRDAQQVATDFGFAANRWDGSMESAVRLLEQPAIHRNLRYGFAQGGAVVAYVDRVLERYDSYRQRFPAVTMPSMLMLADLASR